MTIQSSRSSRFAAFALTFVALTLANPELCAQNVKQRELARRPCDRCAITLEHVVTLSDQQSAVAFGENVLAFGGRSGRLYVVSNTDRALVAVFGSDGGHQADFGRSGAGPGEYRAVMNVIERAPDSLYVLDPLQGRITVLDSEFSVSRTINAPVAIPNVEQLGTNGFVMGGFLMTQGGAGYPLHVFDDTGRHLASFGIDEPLLLLGADRYLIRHLSEANGNSFWAMPPNSYVIERWDYTGRLQEVLRGRADWQKEGADPGFNPLNEDPPGTIVSIKVENETLWILAHVADRDWKPSRRPTGRESAEQQDVHENDYLDTIIELVDLRTGMVLASQRFDEYYWPLHHTKAVYRVLFKENGEPEVAIWNPVLRRGIGQGRPVP
jgi:hypothetical protein